MKWLFVYIIKKYFLEMYFLILKLNSLFVHMYKYVYINAYMLSLPHSNFYILHS